MEMGCPQVEEEYKYASTKRKRRKRMRLGLGLGHWGGDPERKIEGPRKRRTIC